MKDNNTIQATQQRDLTILRSTDNYSLVRDPHGLLRLKDNMCSRSGCGYSTMHIDCQKIDELDDLIYRLNDAQFDKLAMKMISPESAASDIGSEEMYL